MKNIEFGTGGFRGVICDSFNKDNIRLISQALCNVIKRRKSKKPVVIGYDYRFMSDRAALWMSEVLAGNHIQVLLSNQASPTPAVMYLTKEMENDFGAMVTASHNPYDFNGIKLFQDQGMDADVNLTNEIENEIRKIRKIKVIRHYEEDYSLYVGKINFIDQYVSNIQSFISNKVKNSDIKVFRIYYIVFF